MEVDIIIVGQGIAGTVLSRSFELKGKSTFIIDKGFEKASSLIAAGMYNPIVFKRINRSWNTDVFLPYSKDFYNKFDSSLGIDSHIEYNIKRLFPSRDYKELWHQKLDNNEVKDFISVGQESLHEYLIAPDGYGLVRGAGRVDLPLLLTTYREFKKGENQLKEELFDFKQLDLSEERVSYANVEAKHIIFCQGHEGGDNPFFPEIKLNKTKGELITVRAPGFEEKDNINKGFFISPTRENETYVVGSTYNWVDKDTVPTPSVKGLLSGKFETAFSGSYEVIKHTAGLRPTVPDRRPICGLSDTDKKVGVFNGLGTKGVLIAPYLAKNMVEHVLNGKELMSEVLAARFEKND